MLRPGTQIRFRLVAILLVHWEAFLAKNRKWIRPIVFQTVRQIVACRTPALAATSTSARTAGRWRLSLIRVSLASVPAAASWPRTAGRMSCSMSSSTYRTTIW